MGGRGRDILGLGTLLGGPLAPRLRDMTAELPATGAGAPAAAEPCTVQDEVRHLMQHRDEQAASSVIKRAHSQSNFDLVRLSL